MTARLLDTLVWASVFLLIFFIAMARFSAPLAALITEYRGRLAVRNERLRLENEQLQGKAHEREHASLVASMTVDAEAELKKAKMHQRAVEAASAAAVEEATRPDRIAAEREIIAEELAARKLAIQKASAEGAYLRSADTDGALAGAYQSYVDGCLSQDTSIGSWAEWRDGNV